MADITRFLLFRHLRADPTAHIRRLRRGRVVQEGPGLAFWYRPRVTGLSEIPLDDREQALLFTGRTRDFQEVSVQANVTYRIVDPATAAGRIDFAIDPLQGVWRSTPLDQLGGLLTELAQQHTLDLLAGMTLTGALAEGMTAVRERIAAGLSEDERLAATGVGVVDVRVVAVRAEAEVERALQTATREQIQQEADRATYERRAMAVERERAIAENELQNKIELARREEQLVAQEGQNNRQREAERVAARQIEAEGRAERHALEARTAAEATRVRGAAETEVESARVAAYRGAEPATLTLLAATELAGKLPHIGTLNLTPDLLSSALTRLATGEGGQDGARRRGPGDGGDAERRERRQRRARQASPTGRPTPPVEPPAAPTPEDPGPASP